MNRFLAMSRTSAIYICFAISMGTIACSFSGDDSSDTGNDSSDPVYEPLLLSVVLETPERSPLTRRVTVSLREPAEVRFEYWQEDGLRFEREFAPQTVEEQLPLIGLVAGQNSYLVVHVDLEGEQDQSEVIEFQTTDLEFELPVVLGEGSDETPNGGMFLFGAFNSQEFESDRYFWGVDRRGEVVWALDTGEHPPVSGAAIEAVGDNLFVYRSERLVRFVNGYGETVSQIGLSFNPNHDVALLPNGNVIVVEYKQELRNLDLWGEFLFAWDVLREVNPAGEIVWSWDISEHLDVNRMPEGLIFKDGKLEWSHVNSVEYLEETDQLLISVRNQSWVLLVDHKTGEVVWRLGRGGDFSLAGEDWFKGQHDATLQADGSIMVFDNGNIQQAVVPSRVARYMLDTENFEAELVWAYGLDHGYKSMGSARSLEDGGTVIAAGGTRRSDAPLEIIELDLLGEEVWRMGLEGEEGDYLVYRAIPFVYAEVLPEELE